MELPISKKELYEERDKLRNDVIIKINTFLKSKTNALINGKVISIDMAPLQITKAATDFIIEYYNQTGEWEVTLAEEKSMADISDVINFKLI